MRGPLRRYITTTALPRPPVIRIEDGTFYRDYPRNSAIIDPSNPPLFPNLTFSLPSFSDEPQLWSIIGPSLSGKTTLLEILRGQHLCFPYDARSFPYLSSEELERKDGRLRVPGHAIQYVGFGRGSAVGPDNIRGAYLSARYESRREETDFTLLDYLKGHTQLNPAEGEQSSNDDRSPKIRVQTPRSIQLPVPKKRGRPPTVRASSAEKASPAPQAPSPAPQAPSPAFVTANDLHMSAVIRDLKLENLLTLPVGNLSNGQTRRARIARALLGKPEVLLLDEPFMGLDPPTVATLSPLLHRLAAANAPRLILSLRIQDPVPSWITHLIYLSSSAKIVYQGRKSELTGDLKDRIRLMGVDSEDAVRRQDSNSEIAIDSKNTATAGSNVPGDASNGDENISGRAKSRKKHVVAAPIRNFKSRTLLDRIRMRALQAQQAVQDLGEFLVEMEGVKVRYGDQVVLGGWTCTVDGLKKKGLYWSVRRGERWVIFGPNGSGKTTLLSLICSDHPQTYSLPIRIFGRSRLPQPGQPGVSIFDIQARVGHSSPEVHNFFPRHLSIRRTLESAWADTFLGKPVLDHQRDGLVNACLHWFRVDLNPILAHDPTYTGEVSDVPGTLASHTKPKGRPPRWRADQLQNLESQEFLSDDLDWADTLRFGEIPFSAQRVALFLRAILKKPDLVILDEAFSGMDDRLRDKCMLFLVHGETRTLEDANKKQGYKERGKTASRLVRMTGLEDRQALICVSHVKEEIPGVVREWLYLPEPNEGQPPGCGRFRRPLGDNRGQWDDIWKSPSLRKAHSK